MLNNVYVSNVYVVDIYANLILLLQLWVLEQHIADIILQDNHQDISHLMVGLILLKLY